MLLSALPTESSTTTAIRNDGPAVVTVDDSIGANPATGRWSAERMDLAAIRDQLATLTHITLVANGAKGVPEPEPVSRPGVNDGRIYQKAATDAARNMLAGVMGWENG